MFVPLLVLRNAFRHKLRTTLTMIGIVVAIVAFGLLRTIVDAWYAGVEASASTRLITRNAISLVFSMPLNYEQKLRQAPACRSYRKACTGSSAPRPSDQGRAASRRTTSARPPSSVTPATSSASAVAWRLRRPVVRPSPLLMSRQA